MLETSQPKQHAMTPTITKYAPLARRGLLALAFGADALDLPRPGAPPDRFALIRPHLPGA